MRHYSNSLRFTVFAAVAVSLSVATAACTPQQQADTRADIDTQGTAIATMNDGVALTRIPAGELEYYPPGEYLRNGYPAIPALATVRLERDLLMMTRQVSQAEYAQCVAEAGCKPLDRTRRDHIAANLPVVGVSWRDATTYAEWLSKKTGHLYRLPTYVEWVYAAGSVYKEDVILQEFDATDPAQRWLAEYEFENQRKASVDGALRPFKGFGVNENGMVDMAGNVWDWTDSCHVRQHLDNAGSEAPVATGENCGIRVVAGPHRSYIPDFIRDPKGGACSVGVPPSNLGFRLVRDDEARGAVPEKSVRSRLGVI